MPNSLTQLKEMLGTENFFDEPASIVALATSTSVHYPSDAPLPNAVLQARHAGHLRDIFKFCHENGFHLRIKGGGSQGSLTPPQKNELLLLTTALDRVLAIETENRLLSAQCGLRASAINKLLKKYGLWWPVFIPPNSPATIGGLIATNELNLYSIKYGAPGRNLQELEVYLASGKKQVFGCENDQPLNLSFPLGNLFCGSYGLLALISAVKLRVLPRPQAQKHFLIPLSTISEAIHYSSIILKAGLLPDALELLNAEAARFCGTNAQSLLYISFSGNFGELEEITELLLRLLPPTAGKPLTEQENELFLKAYGVWQIKAQGEMRNFVRLKALIPQNSLESYLIGLEELCKSSGIKSAWTIHVGLASIDLLLYGAPIDQLKLAEKQLFTTQLMLNNRMISEKEADLEPDAWKKSREEDRHLSRELARLLDPDKIFSASLF